MDGSNFRPAFLLIASFIACKSDIGANSLNFEEFNLLVLEHLIYFCNVIRRHLF
jgi:hypothetical protein